MEINAAKGFALHPNQADPKRVDQATGDFESLMVGQLLQPMFDTLEVDPLTGGGQAEQMVRSLLVDEYGKKMTAAGGLGLSSAIHAEILKIQEHAQ